MTDFLPAPSLAGALRFGLTEEFEVQTEDPQGGELDGRDGSSSHAPTAGSALVLRALSDESAAKRARAEPDARTRALGVFVVIAMEFLFTAANVQRIISEEGELSADSASMRAMTDHKSTGTLKKRAASIRMYAAWFRTSGFKKDDFLSKPAVFKHLV